VRDLRSVHFLVSPANFWLGCVTFLVDHEENWTRIPFA
jgi:hypothetical protein